MSNQISIRDILRNESEDEEEENESACTPRNRLTGGLLEGPQNTILIQYLQNSSLQGVKYIGQQGRHPVQRLFWICTIIGAFFFSGFLINIGVVKPILSNPVLITFHSSEITIDQIPFPAFTICNVNHVKKSSYLQWKRVVDEYLDYVQKNKSDEYLEKYGEIPNSPMEALRLFSTYCDSMKSFFKGHNHTYTSKFINRTREIGGFKPINFNLDEYMSGSSNDSQMKNFADKYMWPAMAGHCSEMILKCLWKNVEVNCRDIFSPVKTGMGRCCVFNMMPEFIMRGYKKNDRRLDRFERHINASVAEAWRNWNIDEHLVEVMADQKKGRTGEEYPRHQKKAGVWSGLSILVDPQLSEYHCVQGTGYGFRIQTHSPLEHPHVESVGDGVGPNEEVFVGVRAQIITGSVKNLKSYSFKKRQCYFLGEKILNNFKFYTKENCIDECLANGTWKTCGCVLLNQPREGNRSFCIGDEQIKCGYVYIDKMHRRGVRTKCKACIPSCTEVNYASELSRLPMRNDASLWRNYTTGLDETWSNDGLSIIHVYFTTDYVRSKIRKSLFGLKAIIADAGGLLGLTLGFSVISLVEILYFFTLRRTFQAGNSSSISKENSMKSNDDL